MSLYAMRRAARNIVDKDLAFVALDQGRCPFPLLQVPAPGEVGIDYKATCRCGKRVSVTARGLLVRHKPARTIYRWEVK